MWVALKRAVLGLLCTALYDGVMPRDGPFCREVGGEGLADPDGLSPGVVGSHSPQPWQRQHHTNREAISHFCCWCCSAEEVVEHTGGLDASLRQLRTDLDDPPVDPPLGGEDAEGVFNHQPSPGQSVVKDAPLSGEDASGEWPHEVGP